LILYDTKNGHLALTRSLDCQDNPFHVFTYATMQFHENIKAAQHVKEAEKRD